MQNIKKYFMTLALLLTAVSGAWAADYYVVGNFTSWGPNDAYKMTLNTECTSTTEYMLTLDLVAGAQFKVVKYDDGGQTWYPDGMGNAYGENGELSGAGRYTVYFRPNADGNLDWFYGVMYVAAAAPASDGPEMAFNTDCTEASFEMPIYDVDVDYELVRDMSVKMPVTVGDGKADYRIRLKKSTQGGYEPADMNIAQMLALIKVHDAIENKDLAFMGDGKVCNVNIYALDQNDKPTGEAISYASLVPGRYVALAVAAEGTAYTDTTALSNIFQLFEGYELTVPAGEYATYYKDENLYTEDSDVQLYTISSVTATEAVLSAQISVAPAETPLLVYNAGSEAKTILLIPTTNTADEVAVAAAFKGTLADKQMPGSTEGNDYYICNGKAFVWVMQAGTIAANRCWIEIIAQSGSTRSNTRSIVGGGDTTGIDGQLTGDSIDGNDGDGSYYDLQGRKVAQPTRGGIYIKNGKKVIIK